MGCITPAIVPNIEGTEPTESTKLIMKQITDTKNFRLCEEAEATHFSVEPEKVYSEVNTARANELLTAAEISAEVAAEIVRCAARDYDYDDFAENFWNAWGQGYPACEKLGDRLREEAGFVEKVVPSQTFYWRSDEDDTLRYNEKGSWGL